MSVVVRSSGPSCGAVRRRLLPALCASLLAVPMVALPVVGGTALAEAPADLAAAEAPATAAAEPAAAEVAAEPAAEPAAEVAAAEVAEVPPAAAAEPAATAPAVPAAPVAPGSHDDEDPDHAGPKPDDVARPDLVVGLHGPSSGFAGGEGAYTMTVANARTATAPAAGFTVVYTAPAGQTVLSVDAPFDADWACALSDQASCTWFGELAPGQAAPPVTVLAGHGRRAAGTLTGTATVTHLDDEVVLADNTATVATAITTPELALNVGAPERAVAGEAMSMVLSVTNLGPGWVSSFVLYGSVSDGVDVESLGGTGFACDVASLRCDFDDELAPGLSAAVTLTGTVAPAHAGGPVTTTAQTDSAAAMASAVTAVAAAAKPVAVVPVTTPVTAPVAAPVTAPVVAAPLAVSPPRRRVTPVTAPVIRIAPQLVARPQALSGARPATLPFTDTPSTLPFTGSRSGSQLSGGVALLLLGAVLTLAARRRTA